MPEYNKQFFEENKADLVVDNLIDREKAIEFAKKHYSTGLPSLDKNTGGGFEEGLSVLFAPPSVGKTTFLGQFAYYTSLTAPVLFFSLEMSKDDVISKYISMETYLNNPADKLHAVTANKFRSIPFVKNCSEQEWGVVRSAGEIAKTHLKNLYIFDTSISLLTVDDITKVVEAFIRMSPILPVVIIDYIQRIPVPEKLITASEKSQIDYSLNVLTNLAHQNRILVFAISSMLKSNFDNKNADLGAMAGSNRLSYDPDGVYRLSYHNEDDADEDINASRREDIREMDFTIIKQRMCRAGTVINFKFYAAFNYFFEPEANIDQEELDRENPFEQSRNEPIQASLFDGMTMIKGK